MAPGVAARQLNPTSVRPAYRSHSRVWKNKLVPVVQIEVTFEKFVKPIR